MTNIATKKLDLINLNGIESFSRLGIFDWEKEAGQIIKVDLALSLSLENAAKSDAMSDTIDYVEISKSVQRSSQKKEYNLIEHLAHEIILDLFTQFEEIEEIHIKVYKPVIKAKDFSGNVSIELKRSRQGMR